MAWRVEFGDEAEKDFAKLDKAVQRRVFRFLHERVARADDPRNFGKALLHEMAGLWRYRVGDYRILCRIEGETLTVLVVAIEHRSKVYR